MIFFKLTDRITHALARSDSRRRTVDGARWLWHRWTTRLIYRRAVRKVNRCLRCDPTARALRQVQAQWVVAGIDLD